MNLVIAPLVALSLITLSSLSAAEEPYRMEEVYVSASRLAGDLATSGRNVVILDRQDIERRAALSIADLLGGLPGVDSRSRGPFGIQTDLEVAGSTFSQVLILVDGVRVNDPQTGHHNLNVPLEPNDLDSLEIVYGAGSAVHGPDAFGAVINLVPRRTVKGTKVEIASHWGENLDEGVGVGSDVAGVGTDVAIRHGWSTDRGDLWISAGKRRSDGYRTNTDFDVDRFFVRGSTAAFKGELSLQAGLQDKQFGAEDFYGDASKEWTKAWLYSVQYRSASGVGRHLTARAFYRRHRDRFVLRISDPAFYENRHLSERAGLEGSATVATGAWGSLLAGAEVARESIDSRNLNSSRSGLGDHGRWRSAYFTEYGGRAGAGTLSAGLRFDRHERFGWEASPSIGLSYLWRRHRLFASAARAYRAPSFTEFYYEDTRNRGNPDLAAESGWSYESGIETGLVGGARLRSSVFARFENNLVDYVRDDPDSLWQATNLGEMRSVGIQLHGERNWGTRFKPQIDYMWVDKEQTLAPGTFSKYVFTHPTHQLTVRVDHAVVAGVSAGWQVQMKQRSGQDDYTLVDLVLSRSFGIGRSLLRVQNLTDQRYEAVGGVPMPGRWLSLETQFEL
jgi:vitamin B12 transporter